MSRTLKIRGDRTQLDLPATDPLTGAAFDLDAMENVIFTAKTALTDTDAEAVFQKELAAGITVDGTTATLTILTIDTQPLGGRTTTLYCDLQAESAEGELTTVWIGTLTFRADVTRESTASVTIYALTASMRLINQPELVGLTGGGATKLDGLATKTGTTVNMPTGSIVVLSYGRVGQQWQLIAGTDAEDETAGVVRPDDYDASTNARIWVQL